MSFFSNDKSLKYKIENSKFIGNSRKDISAKYVKLEINN